MDPSTADVASNGSEAGGEGRTMGDEQSMIVLEQLEKYSKFSFILNGVVTCLLAAFGLIGNATLFYQIRHSHHFSKRLASHLQILCVWDMMLLLCCLITYGVVSLYYGMIPLVGIVAYILYLFQPFASFCVIGTIWQVCAITIERYMAVSRPLEQRTRKAQFSVRAIFLTICFGAFVLNVFPVPFERTLTECFEITETGFRVRTMIRQNDIINNQIYAILVHLIPDIIFRAPLPVFAIAILTVRTLQICRNRTVGHHTFQQQKKNIPFMLTLLNAKFILCNTLYMFNTILTEVLGYGNKTSRENEDNVQQYISTLYLADLSNVLLALHSSTNWLLFCHWPSFKKTEFKSEAEQMSTMLSTGNSISKTSLCEPKSAEVLLTRFLEKGQEASKGAIVTLCKLNKRFVEFVTNDPVVNIKDIAEHPKVSKATTNVQEFIVQLLQSFADRTSSLNDIKTSCRQVGYNHFDANIHCTVEQFKLIRDEMLSAIVPHSQKQSSLSRSATRIYNWTLREIKSGALCASVDATQQVRSAVLYQLSTESSQFLAVPFPQNIGDRTEVDAPQAASAAFVYRNPETLQP
ncbi:hypothetical protein L596_015125 [Steinernema carpocapsae]|uniref:G-protein coupled receptors family 1 profile domain-containing protein n=1 Tax=Steinernema carpocapsae TaxID=34508 RepID=A0A4U5NEL3_STECR|nr:hypothetical protein L596_015125 [Steinernema carpocapsae]